MYRDYHAKGVEFFYVYKSVEHPEINNFVSAYTLEERLMHVAEAKRRFNTEIPWLCDTMENDMKSILGRAPNGEYIVGPDGKLLKKYFWSNPARLRSDLAELVGESETVTKVEDLETSFAVETREVASGVVPKVELPRGLVPMKLKPILDDANPFFAKLRVETTRNFFSTGKGKMYFGLHLDPLYKVHWNNRAGKVTIKLEAPEGATLSETELAFPEVAEDADIDPRVFLVDIEGHEPGRAMRAVVIYTVCDDAETFCVTVEQEYKLPMTRGRDLGSRPGIFMPAMFADMMKMDKNGDGNLTKDELPPGQVTMYIGHIDYNGNEIIEADEIKKFLTMFNNGRGFDSPFNDGQKKEKD